ncbi:hypothetical protein [Adlercreutzia sp. ZJ138]|uniref:hypothetical protein n=1 Tax=Adlercreutzia sp. ZJ138 TaxID=2709405 RepID=UPI0013EA47BD|nr:hypothetical protein [Adlercreutzia sp. ZJ138]
MTSKNVANIEKLNYAITSLNEDAEDVHDLISRSTTELKEATATGNRVADSVCEAIEALDPLVEKLAAQIDTSTHILEETKITADKQRVSISKSLDKIKADLEQTVQQFNDEHVRQFEDFKLKSLKESKKTRDELQTDLLTSKTTAAARFDSLESEVTKLAHQVEALKEDTSELVRPFQSKMQALLCAAIALGAIDSICLVLLLLR